MFVPNKSLQYILMLASEAFELQEWSTFHSSLHTLPAIIRIDNIGLHGTNIGLNVKKLFIVVTYKFL